MDERDDFGCFAGSEHMFFGLVDPYGWVRRGIEDSLREQIADTEVLRIAAHGAPLFVTAGRRQPDDASKIVVTRSAFAVRVRLEVRSVSRSIHQPIEGAVTALFANVDRRDGTTRSRFTLDLGPDVERGMTPEVLEQRFMAHAAEAHG